MELYDGTMFYLTSGMAKLPLIPGHEWSGEVVALGGSVSEFAVGDRVTGECSVGCLKCNYCVKGWYNQCPNRTETGLLTVSPVTTARRASKTSVTPRPPASTTPACAKTSNCSGVRSKASRAARLAARTTSDSDPSTDSTASAAARMTVSIVPSTGWATASYPAWAARRSTRRN